MFQRLKKQNYLFNNIFRRSHGHFYRTIGDGVH